LGLVPERRITLIARIKSGLFILVSLRQLAMCGVRQVVSKPFLLHEMVALVRKLLAKTA